MSELLQLSAFLIFIFMSSLYAIALIIKDNSIADIGWGIGFILIALGAIAYAGDFTRL